MNSKLSADETSLWAKKNTENGEQRWLPLVVHLTDAANVMNWLYYHWLDEGQRQFLTTTLPDEEMQKLVKFLGFFHDFGKATPAFQTKKSYDGNRSLDAELLELLSRHGFADLTNLVLASPQKSPHALAGEALLESDRFNVPAAIGAIIGGHHGKPGRWAPKRQLKDYPANYCQIDGIPDDPQEREREQWIKLNWEDVQQRLFAYGLELAGYQDAAEIPTVNQPQAVILEGLLIMADWLASSEYLDAAQTIPLFPLIRLDESYQDVDLTARYQHAILTWKRTDKWEPHQVAVNDSQDQQQHRDPYFDRWGFTARDVQLIMTQAVQATTDPGMVIVEAGMGVGKTEIALVAAEQLAAKTGRNGVFMGLPTQATTNAMFSRVVAWARQLANAEGKKLPINLMHGKKQFNQNFQNLPDAANVYDHDQQLVGNQSETKAQSEAGAVVVNGWFSGKKSILADFTVGTIDNLLLMGLKKKHLFLRHLGFSGKVVIIDEVHAYDTYMNSYLYKAINWLGAYHVPIIVLSATLPIAKRNKLIYAYLKGKYGRQYKKRLQAPAGWDQAQAYPLLTLVDGQTIKQTTDFNQRQAANTTVQIQRLNLDDAALIKAVMVKIQAGGVAGVIVNTVKRAQALAKLVLAHPGDVQLMVLHSAFLAPDRSKQEQALQRAIGKGGTRPKKLIVIGTQVLEQSLDIDFDVLYTDIAPMDLILQRIGRLHRHQITRPVALQHPQTFILGVQGPGDYGDANEAVYEKYLLMKTDHFLGETVALPRDISRLVQKVYDPATDDEVAGIELAKEDFEDDRDREKARSKVFQVAPPKLKAGQTIHGWLDWDDQSLDKDEQNASAAVRDIQESIEVVLVQHTAHGDYLLDGRPLNTVKPQEIAEQVLRLPTAVTPRNSVVAQVITTLEQRTGDQFADWQLSPWLRGALALSLDDQATTTLGRWSLTYSTKLGLSYEKEDEHD
ncbi:CRISPR-associated helicase/endonuclease Cas3 [Levilactobacillus acidifarinae]|uniref:HD Cas3-type domain-containing protein n=1 Tax=Levilactobacillus acidifarinae DSM 19394 = JCM 15949 TaxID=1423715 RepID=A0A0R1LF07_9LACO|nr:CRISPR-associated helicase/endonuclease Cas3 [Levilactobacillus acidifarinae]KRK94411.1 hypothetical protein FD25_GL000371 [Levilactobacillus acidifarinae DSM 19394]GEO68151.1 CRISPR-associated helicase/endonuclease Cas3 [Levilactobacillus acidifarinae]